MMLKSNLLKVSAVAVIAAMLGVTSCDEVEEKLGIITPADAADVTDDAQAEAYFQDLDDLASVAIDAPEDEQFAPAGRTKSGIVINDHRFTCDGTIVSLDPAGDSSPEHPKGTLTIDFGTTGCADASGVIRKGKVIITYNDTRFVPGASLVVTTEEYSVNGVKLEGTRTLTNLEGSTLEAPRFKVTLEDGKITFEDQDVATRESEVTMSWNRGSESEKEGLTVEEGSWAKGTSRAGRAYETAVTKSIFFDRACGKPVSGIKTFTTDDDKEISIDFGDGTCDNDAIVKIGEVTREISF